MITDARTAAQEILEILDSDFRENSSNKLTRLLTCSRILARETLAHDPASGLKLPSTPAEAKLYNRYLIELCKKDPYDAVGLLTEIRDGFCSTCNRCESDHRCFCWRDE